MLTADDLRVGATYRGKRRRRVTMTEYNDRTILWMDAERTVVQYDAAAVGMGRHYPRVPMAQFLRWAHSEVEVES